jgi:signal transduction histidine kinase
VSTRQKHVAGTAAGLKQLVKNVSGKSSPVSALFVLMVFGVEVGVGIFVIRDLLTAYRDVQQVYAGSVRGLRSIGELQYQAQETRRSTLYALATSDGNLQVTYADQSREADKRVTDGIAEYLAQARTPREIGVGKRLANDWDTYLKIRNDVLGLILESSTKEAVDVDLKSGVPLFDRVRQDLDDVKRLYEEQASQQLAVVAVSSRRLVVKLIGGLGFAVLFGSLAIWAIQRSEMRGAVQLAKLQMDFVASVSHEIRTPLTAILSAGENVRDGLVDGREGLVEQGSIIVDQAARLADLVDEVLLFAATIKGKPRYTVRPLQVSEILECALRNSAVLLQKSGFTIERQVQQGLPRVEGDLSAISQCLQNLIVNAVKYSDKDRWIGLSARIDESATDSKGVRISVQDRGVGISSSDLPRIFEPFYRSPRVVEAQIHGTGLGLSIAKSNAEALGGRLSVISEVDVGSIFTLHLPVAEEDRKLAPVTSAAD